MAAATEKKTKPDTLVGALIAFQSDIPRITKSSTADTGKYSYTYASLEKLTPIILGRLSELGVAYVAAPHLTEEGNFVLRASLLHESGDKLSGDYPLGNPNAPAQAIGSAITYARRYALLSLTGVAPEGEDDDGAAGADAAGSTRTVEAAKPKAKGKEEYRAEISALIEAGKTTGEQANATLEKISGSNVPANWTATHFKKAVEELSK